METKKELEINIIKKNEKKKKRKTSASSTRSIKQTPFSLRFGNTTNKNASPNYECDLVRSQIIHPIVALSSGE